METPPRPATQASPSRATVSDELVDAAARTLANDHAGLITSIRVLLPTPEGGASQPDDLLDWRYVGLVQRSSHGLGYRVLVLTRALLPSRHRVRVAGLRRL